MIDFGVVRPGTTLYVPFATYDSNDPTASVTMTGFAVTDIEIYKDGGTTQRASDSGVALLDTDGTDFDALTGIHGFSINLADNTTAGFYGSGSQYWAVVSSVTIDAGTINFIAATWRIGYPDAILNTTIATLASQTSFTLTAGPPDNNALVGCVALIHSVASAVQMEMGVVSAYTGSTRTVTLAADPGVFAATAADNIAFYFPINTRWLSGTVQTARDLGASVLLSSGTGTGQVSLSSGAVLLQPTQTGVTIPTVTNLTNAPTAGDLTATMKTSVTTAATAATPTAAAVTGAVGSVTGAVGSVTGNVGGNVTGSVGSVTGAVGSVAANGITATSFATDAINANSVKADAVTKIQTGLATPTNITAGTITTVTNLTNAPTAGDLTAAMITSVTTAVTAAVGVTAGVNVMFVNGLQVVGDGTVTSPWGPGSTP